MVRGVRSEWGFVVGRGPAPTAALAPGWCAGPRVRLLGLLGALLTAGGL